MDPLTHAVSGAVLARALPRKSLPPGQVLLLAGLAMLPDIDIVLSWFSDVAYLRYHRGITHSLLMLPLWVWLLRALLGQRTGLPTWLIAAAIALHIGLDVITSFGTMVFAPLSDWRASLDWVFIIDPCFTVCWLLPLLLGLILRRHARRMARLALILAACYLTLTFGAHRQALDIAQALAPEARAVAALPLPFSPLHWQLIVDEGAEYARAMLDLAPGWPDLGALFPARFHEQFLPALPTKQLQWQRFPKLRLPSETSGGARFYLWFARFPVTLRRDERGIEAGDLRFGIERDARRWPFRLRLHAGGARLIWREGRETPLSSEQRPVQK